MRRCRFRRANLDEFEKDLARDYKVSREERLYLSPYTGKIVREVFLRVESDNLEAKLYPLQAYLYFKDPKLPEQELTELDRGLRRRVKSRYRLPLDREFVTLLCLPFVILALMYLLRP
jgi:hypothetical protein